MKSYNNSKNLIIKSFKTNGFLIDLMISGVPLGGTGVGVVSLVVVIGGRLLALIVDRGHGLVFVVGAYTYL